MARGIGLTSEERKTCRRTNPKRGATCRKGKHRPLGTHYTAEQGLEVEGAGCGSRLAGEQSARNDKGAQSSDELRWLRGRRNP
jgi:hypothetical protein